MDAKKIIVRAARREDAAVIAHAVAMAIGDETALCNYCGEDYMAVLKDIAAADATQYSWRYALVAEVDGAAIGAVVGYDGGELMALRNGTFEVLKRSIGRVPNIVDETEAGEYYLDSVGVLPQYRGLGVGRALVAAFCDKAFAEGHERVGLIVDCDNPNAETLYTSLGFERVGTKLFFGHNMWHLQRSNDMDIRKRVELSTSITPFQRRVYLELLNVPAGQTITYGELACRIGCRSAQAVGQALRRNPFAPEVPCHRVVAADGSLCGYNGHRDGEHIERKRILLESERRQNSMFKIVEVADRTQDLIADLTRLWEASVRATHHFLSEADICEIREFVPVALANIPYLLVAKDDTGPVAFMGVDGRAIEMLFVDHARRGMGIGRSLIQYGIANYGIETVSVNEQNPEAVGFYQRMGFSVFRRTDIDEQGRPFPILYMTLRKNDPSTVAEESNI